MSENISLIMYSHSSYSDVWKPFFSQAEKFLPKYKKILFTDSVPVDIPAEWDSVIYDNKMSYSERMAHCLSAIDTQLFFYHHEDMFLYDKPDLELLNKYEQLVMNDNVDFIRLIRSVDNPMFNFKGHATLYPIPSHSRYYFTVQPTIAKTDRMIRVFQQTKINNIREFEVKVQNVCKKNNIKGLFHYDGEAKRGESHYDSNVYPYVATAIVKGKWNFKEYRSELSKILNDLKIDSQIRGKYD
jgi:hypothetical protein